MTCAWQRKTRLKRKVSPTLCFPTHQSTRIFATTEIIWKHGEKGKQCPEGRDCGDESEEANAKGQTEKVKRLLGHLGWGVQLEERLRASLSQGCSLPTLTILVLSSLDCRLLGAETFACVYLLILLSACKLMSQ